MNLNSLPKDVLYYMALDMDVADIILTHSLTYHPSLGMIKYCIDKGVEITSNMIENLDMYSDVGLPYSKNTKTYLEARELMEKHLK